MSFNYLGFKDVLPYLASAYRRSLLVPFIGSGMSVGACTNWEDFATGLVKEAGLGSSSPPGSGDAPDSAALYRLADKAVLGLTALNIEARIEAYRCALNAKGKKAGECAIPDQTQALAQCYWPLVLTTNYDDLYVVSRMKQSKPEMLGGVARRGSSAKDEANELVETDIPEVLGRSTEDCHKVLRSLDSPTRPILWALQGFLGGQADRIEALFEKRVVDKRRHLELARQVVVGHQQYQQAINAEHHFRRSFAEVFSRRSLLFLGSGILEDYLVNLFGEIAHHYGPGPHPHFALFCRESFKDPKATDPSMNRGKKEPPDLRFFQMRLGITPVVFDRYEELPDFLNQLVEAVGERPRRSTSVTSAPSSWLPDELSFRLTDGLQRIVPDEDDPAAAGSGPLPAAASSKPAETPRKLRLLYAPLSAPAGKGECVIVSVGRTVKDKRPIHGRQATGLLKKAQEADLITHTRDGWKAFRTGLNRPLAYRFENAPIFAVAARIDLKNPPAVPDADDPEDSRDLGIIVDAVSEALEMANQAGFTHVHMGPVASGQFRLWTPLHPFMQTLAGVRQYFAQHPDSGIRLVELHVFSPSVWYPVVSGKIPVGEILSSDMMKIWVDVRNPDGSSEIFSVTTRGPKPVQVIKEICGLPADRWSTEILPRSGKEDPSDEDDRLVTPASIVVFSPRKPAAAAPLASGTATSSSPTGSGKP